MKNYIVIVLQLIDNSLILDHKFMIIFDYDGIL